MYLQAIGQVASYDQRNLLLPQFLDGDLQRVGLSLDVNENGCVHAEMPSNIGTRIVSLVAENTDGDSPKLASTPAHFGKGWG